ncbi:MAG TPA: octaprenyl-diphosphate synthase, partial [Dokdonella sp.]|nr:octaprenyl-diphosphate synthase [Dokdonella sp.]
GGLDALDDVLAAIHATDALDASRRRAHEYADSARDALAALPRSDARDALAVLADYAVDRTR